jgi:DnaK suppressor protein
MKKSQPKRKTKGASKKVKPAGRKVPLKVVFESRRVRKSDMKKFKKLFEDQRQALLYNDKILREDFAVNVDDRYDEVDQASTDAEQAMRMRLRNRERLYMLKIEEALTRISEGTFGLCTTCEEPIELRRLEARPTATLCVACKEDEERVEGATAAGQKHKSLGDQIIRFH